jgi:hypothetical protein
MISMQMSTDLNCGELPDNTFPVENLPQIPCDATEKNPEFNDMHSERPSLNTRGSGNVRKKERLVSANKILLSCRFNDEDEIVSAVGIYRNPTESP